MVVAVLAVGQTLVFLTRNFDLSLGSIVGLTAYIVGQQLWHHPEIPPGRAVLLALGSRRGDGLDQRAADRVWPGARRSSRRSRPWRSTAASWSSTRNAIPITTNQPAEVAGQPVSPEPVPASGKSSSGRCSLIMISVVVLFQLVLTYLPFGRRLYAIGSNPDAARIAGFPAQRIVFLAFVLSGHAGGAGAASCSSARYGNITVLAGTGLEFSSIAAVVVGGVSNMGGSGTVIGAFLGALLILDLLENSLFRWAVDQRVLARRHPGHVDPAGRRARLRRLRPPEEPVGPVRLADAAPTTPSQKAGGGRPCPLEIRPSHPRASPFLTVAWRRLKSWEGLAARDPDRASSLINTSAGARLPDYRQPDQPVHPVDREDHRSR